jgi:hypothetical protein
MWKEYDSQAGNVDGASVHVVIGVCNVVDDDKDEERAGGCRGRGVSDAGVFSLRWDFRAGRHFRLSGRTWTDSREQSFITLVSTIIFPLMRPCLYLDFINTFRYYSASQVSTAPPCAWEVLEGALLLPSR